MKRPLLDQYDREIFHQDNLPADLVRARYQNAKLKQAMGRAISETGLKSAWTKFESWFNEKCGWFFVNGNKKDEWTRKK